MSKLTAYTGATLYPVEGPPVRNGTMLTSDGRIQCIGTCDVEIPSDAAIVDLRGRVVIPGIVDAHSHVGIMGDGDGPGANDANEMPEAVNGKIRVIDSVDPRQRSFEFAREGGITTACIVPLGNPIAGTAAVLKTSGRTVDGMIVRNPAGLKCALGEGPKRSHGQARKQAPFTRMGTAALVRDFFRSAAEYAAGRPPKGGPVGLNLGLEAGAMVLKGQIPFRVHAHRQDDIVTAVRLAEEFGIQYRIEHCTEGHLIAEFLAKHGVIAHVGPGLFCRRPQEWARADERNAAILHAAGVKVCLVTDHPFLDSRYILASAAIVWKYGMPFEDVLRALTLWPAESLGVQDRVGSLRAGKDADFVVLSGEPLRYKSVVLSTYAGGVEVYHRPIYGSDCVVNNVE